MKSMLFSILSVVLLAACATQPSVIGKWQSLGNEGTLELMEDGTFISTDNLGGIAGGDYKILSDDRIRFEITETDVLKDGLQPATPHELIEMTVFVSKTELQLSHATGDKPEIYIRSE